MPVPDSVIQDPGLAWYLNSIVPVFLQLTCCSGRHEPRASEPGFCVRYHFCDPPDWRFSEFLAGRHIHCAQWQLPGNMALGYCAVLHRLSSQLHHSPGCQKDIKDGSTVSPVAVSLTAVSMIATVLFYSYRGKATASAYSFCRTRRNVCSEGRWSSLWVQRTHEKLSLQSKGIQAN